MAVSELEEMKAALPLTLAKKGVSPPTFVAVCAQRRADWVVLQRDYVPRANYEALVAALVAIRDSGMSRSPHYAALAESKAREALAAAAAVPLRTGGSRPVPQAGP